MIPFLDLKKINEKYRDELDSVYHEVMDSGWYLLGKQNEKLEAQLSEYLSVPYCLAVSSGLDALRILFRSYLEIGVLQEGDSVLVPSHTFIASILAITENNLKPIFVEPAVNTYNVGVHDLKEKYTSKVKAFLNVHLYGEVSYSEELDSFLKENNILHIEDNAQAIGAAWQGKKTGNIGDAAAFSFYPGKNLGALGDGGAISTSNKELYEVCKSIRNYGSEQKYKNKYKGYNARLDELQCAFLGVKLKYIDTENSIRRDIAEYYSKHINHPEIVVPQFKKNISHVWHLYVIQVKNGRRDELQNYLLEQGIQTLIHYPIPVHHQEAYKEYANISLPIAEQLSSEILSLPISSVLEESEMKKIVNSINTFACK